MCLVKVLFYGVVAQFNLRLGHYKQHSHTVSTQQPHCVNGADYCQKCQLDLLVEYLNCQLRELFYLISCLINVLNISFRF